MIRVSDNIDEILESGWETFVLSQSKGSVFQTPSMYRCYLKTEGHSPLVLGAFDGSDLVGVLMSDVMYERGFLKKKFTTRSVIMGGPVIKGDSPLILDALLSYYQANFTKQVVYSQIRNQFDQLANNDVFQKYGFRFEPHLNFIITLDSEDKVWDRIGKGRKKQIKKAVKNGLTVRTFLPNEIPESLLSECYSVIDVNYHRIGLPVADKELFASARQEQILVLFVVYDKDEHIIGCRMALGYNKCLYGWYAGSREQYYHLFPNDLLIWETLKWGVNNGYAFFDYGGAGNPNQPYGVREFKAQAGGILVDYGRYQCVHNQMKYFLGKIALRMYKMVKRLS